MLTFTLAPAAAAALCCCYLSKPVPCVCVPSYKASCNSVCDSDPMFSGPCGSCLGPPGSGSYCNASRTEAGKFRQMQRIRSSDDFDGSAQFERWSYFKDVGIPATLHDILNRAAIADGSCRMLNGHAFGGYALWYNSSLASSVISVMSVLPPTTRHSHFVHEANRALSGVCPSGEVGVAPMSPVGGGFQLAAVATSLNAWYRALCSPEGDPSWGRIFDPADQRQQITLTAGLMCIVTCDAHNASLPTVAMDSLRLTGLASAAACLSLPWSHGKPAVDFTKAGSFGELATMLQPLREDHEGGSIPAMCGCYSY